MGWVSHVSTLRLCTQANPYPRRREQGEGAVSGGHMALGWCPSPGSASPLPIGMCRAAAWYSTQEILAGRQRERGGHKGGLAVTPFPQRHGEDQPAPRRPALPGEWTPGVGTGAVADFEG